MLMTPLSLSAVQTSVSVKRVGEFLRSEELDPDIVDWREEPAMGELHAHAHTCTLNI